MSDYKLYTYWRSSASWRVRIVMALKELQYESKIVNLLKGAQREEDYKSSVHPNGLVPALSFYNSEEEIIITQSLAIIDYLEASHSDSYSVYPKCPLTRARAQELSLTLACDTHPLQNLRVLASYPEAEKPEKAKTVIANGLRVYENILQKIHKDKSPDDFKYSVGDDVTIADVVLVPQVYNAVRWGVDMSEFPRISSINSHLATLPAFIAAHPDAQPDAVKA